MTFHLFFEQSGTFKNELRELGYEAMDYDILNDFGQTDVVIDLFAEIEKSYAGGGSIFDNITEDDMIIAFFPCVRFENQIIINMRGDHIEIKKWNDDKKLEYSMKLNNELNHMYQLISKLAIVCIKKENSPGDRKPIQQSALPHTVLAAKAGNHRSRPPA